MDQSEEAALNSLLAFACFCFCFVLSGIQSLSRISGMARLIFLAATWWLLGRDEAAVASSVLIFNFFSDLESRFCVCVCSPLIGRVRAACKNGPWDNWRGGGVISARLAFGKRFVLAKT